MARRPGEQRVWAAARRRCRRLGAAAALLAQGASSTPCDCCRSSRRLRTCCPAASTPPCAPSSRWAASPLCLIASRCVRVPGFMGSVGCCLPRHRCSNQRRGGRRGAAWHACLRPPSRQRLRLPCASPLRALLLPLTPTPLLRALAIAGRLLLGRRQQQVHRLWWVLGAGCRLGGGPAWVHAGCRPFGSAGRRMQGKARPASRPALTSDPRLPARPQSAPGAPPLWVPATTRSTPRSRPRSTRAPRSARPASWRCARPPWQRRPGLVHSWVDGDAASCGGGQQGRLRCTVLG